MFKKVQVIISFTYIKNKPQYLSQTCFSYLTAGNVVFERGTRNSLLFSLFMGFMHALFICGELKVHIHSLTQMRP